MEIKSLPHSVELEKIVIAAMFMDLDAIGKVREVLRSDDFYLDQHKKICNVIFNLYEKGKPVDMLLVAEELKNKGEFDAVGGSSYISEIASSAMSSANVEKYAEIIYEKAILRDVIKASNKMVEHAYEQNISIEELLDEAESTIFKIRENRKRGDLKPIKSFLEEIFTTIDKRHKERNIVTGLSTGFNKIDFFTAGLQKGEFIVIAGRPSTGKTAIALNIATNIARNLNKPVLFFSLEMHYEQLLYRLIACESGVDSSLIRSGRFADSQEVDISSAIARLNKIPIWIDSTPAISISEFRSKARRMRKNEHIEAVFVDYLQLISGPSKSENRTQEVSAISRALKSIAMELDIPVVALSQLSRAFRERTGKKEEEAPPILSDLRESGQIEQDADVVILLHREKIGKEDETVKKDDDLIDDILKVRVDIAKNRNGPVGKFRLAFQTRLVRFRDIKEMDGETL